MYGDIVVGLLEPCCRIRLRGVVELLVIIAACLLDNAFRFRPDHTRYWERAVPVGRMVDDRLGEVRVGWTGCRPVQLVMYGLSINGNAGFGEVLRGHRRAARLTLEQLA